MSGIVTASAAVLNQQNDEKSMTKTLPNSPRQFHKSDETESNIKPVIAKAQNDTIIETEKKHERSVRVSESFLKSISGRNYD
jgi:hypothetical protein